MQTYVVVGVTWLVSFREFLLEPVVVGGGPNYSGLRLKYNKANGTFKGSFNLYLRDERRGSNKAKGLKKRFNVTGVVVNGIGYGVANSRDIGSFNVRIW